MPLPEFLAELRSVIGNGFVLLPGVRAVVRDEFGRVLMIRRSDFDRWDVPSGIIEPGEEPAHTVVREVFEETGMVVRPVSIMGVYAGDRVTYPNGDVAQYVTVVFACEIVGGTLRPDGHEALEAAFLPADRPPVADRLAAMPSGGSFVWDDSWLGEFDT